MGWKPMLRKPTGWKPVLRGAGSLPAKRMRQIVRTIFSGKMPALPVAGASSETLAQGAAVSRPLDEAQRASPSKGI